MKAATYDAPGAPNVLKIEDVPDAVARDHELLVRVEAISIEGGDLIARRETTPGVPAKTIGYAAAGTIIGLGNEVQGFEVGQKVATFDFTGSHAELRAVSAATSWAIPAGLDVEIAATIPCGPGTAAMAIQLGGLKQGQTVLITGATGGVGLAAIQLAAKAGAYVIGTGTNPVALEQLRHFGLNEGIVTASDGGASEQVRALLSGGVDLLIDNVGGSTLIDGLKAVKDGGRAVLIGVFGGRAHHIDPWQILVHRQTIVGCLLGAVMSEPQPRQLIGDLLERAARGDISVPIDSVFSLADVDKAHARAEARGKIGRVIMRP